MCAGKFLRTGAELFIFDLEVFNFLLNIQFVVFDLSFEGELFLFDQGYFIADGEEFGLVFDEDWLGFDFRPSVFYFHVLLFSGVNDDDVFFEGLE